MTQRDLTIGHQLSKLSREVTPPGLSLGACTGVMFGFVGLYYLVIGAICLLFAQ